MGYLVIKQKVRNNNTHRYLTHNEPGYLTMSSAQYTACHSSNLLLVHTIPTLTSPRKQDLQRQHTRSHGGLFR